MIYAITGQHTPLTDAEREYVRRIVKRTVLRNKRNKFVSGVAFGVDTEGILAVWGLLPFENLILTVPGTAQHNWGLVDKAEEAGAVIIRCKTLHTARETYLNRDDVTQEQLGKNGTLLAFPRRTTFYRSGTWAQINRARKANTKVRMYPLSNAS